MNLNSVLNALICQEDLFGGGQNCVPAWNKSSRAKARRPNAEINEIAEKKKLILIIIGTIDVTRCGDGTHFD